MLCKLLLLALLVLVVPPPLPLLFNLPPLIHFMLNIAPLLVHLPLLTRLIYILRIMLIPCLATIECIAAEEEAEVRPLALQFPPWRSTLWIFQWPWKRRRSMTHSSSQPISHFEFQKLNQAIPARGLGKGCVNTLSLSFFLPVA